MPTTWTARIWAEYRAGTITRAARDVLLTLHTFRGTGGRCWPSHATLADRAKCCTRTVQRALQQAQGLGLVAWAERRVRAGWRWLRSSNLYRFVVPSGEVVTNGTLPKVRTASFLKPSVFPQAPLPDIAAGEGGVSKKQALNALLRAAAGQPDLLAMRREAWARGMIGGTGRTVTGAIT